MAELRGVVGDDECEAVHADRITIAKEGGCVLQGKEEREHAAVEQAGGSQAAFAMIVVRGLQQRQEAWEERGNLGDLTTVQHTAELLSRDTYARDSVHLTPGRPSNKPGDNAGCRAAQRVLCVLQHGFSGSLDIPIASIALLRINDLCVGARIRTAVLQQEQARAGRLTDTGWND
jgi:hypothetical protein